MQEIVVKPRDVMPEGALTLPAEFYVSEARFATELDLLFRRMWICVGRGEEVALPGQFVLRELPGDNIIVTRAQDGTVHAFHNVCRHRGTRLCTDHAGTFAGSIQCPYHAWTYGLDGRLLGAPHMDEVPHFRKEDYPLTALQADEWDGHVFVNFWESAPPLRHQLGELPAKFEQWGMSDLRLGHRIVYDVKANWKLIIQNYNECLHCPNLHPALNKLSHYLSGENEPLRTTYMGGRMDLRPGVETLSMDGTCPRGLLPGLSGEDRRRVYYYAIFPNMLLSLHPDYMMVHTLWPVGSGPDHQRLRVALPSRGAAKARLQRVGRDRVLGSHQPPGLARLRALAGRHRIQGVSAGPVLEPRGSALRVRSHDSAGARAGLASWTAFAKAPRAGRT